ncbi:hypothetical protein BN159_7737 [Streptomyces davaonensis JCM 4913]|uniref:Uncharacterized protein n=1 Tax=Streptomyces davaonensis (strain DSM 101723 / JCM 4913 / KCC S-0913 / 768) TaxID=1214101 RepID=K4R761_STRDJ|nr:hypothetical protein BN159_7737 [Streptomyces davaonensis JCM 4913]
MTQDDKSAHPEEIVPALIPAYPGITACFGRARTIAATTCAGTPSMKCANASSPAAALAVAANPIDHAGLLRNTPPAEVPFREHQCLPGPRAGRAPGLLPPRQLPHSVHQPHRAERSRGAQRYPHLDRLPGHPRRPRPCAAHTVGCGLALVPRQSLLHGSRPRHGSARSRNRWVLNLPPAPIEQRGRRQRDRLAAAQRARRDVGTLRSPGPALPPCGPLPAPCPRHVAGAPFWQSVPEVSDV